MVGPVTDEGKTLGQMLRARREARGLSQEQAAQQARVQLVFVRALEDDDYHLLPDELYLTRFLYEYATFLKLDPAAADATFRRQFRRPAAHSPLYRAVPRLAALPWRRLLWAAAAFLSLIPLAFILLSLVGKERETPPPPSPVAAGETESRWFPPEPAASPGEARAVPAPDVAEPSPARALLTGRGAAPETGQRHVLVVRARELTWLAVRVDGGDEHEVLLREGEMVRWSAVQGFLLTVGNAGGVDLVLDGHPVHLPARRGEVVRDLRLPPIASSSP